MLKHVGISESFSTTICPVLVKFHNQTGLMVASAHPFPEEPLAGMLDTKLQVKKQSGISPHSSLDLKDPDNLANLSPDRKSTIEVAKIIGEAIGGSGYYLMGNPVNSPSIYQASIGTVWGRQAVIQAEEGLSVLAANIVRSVMDVATTFDSEADGKTYAILPGYASPVALKGYWLNRSSRGEAGQLTHVPNIPACEPYMAATMLDQVEHGDKLVRIAPSTMEDRESYAARILELLGMAPKKTVSSVIIAPSGDVKKVRTWFGKPDTALQEIVQPMKVDAKANRLSEEFSTDRARQYAIAYRNLPEDIRKVIPSPNACGGTPSEKISLFLNNPYLTFAIFEKHKPSKGTSVDALRTTLDAIDNQAGRSRLSITGEESSFELREHTGRNTNNVVELRVRVAQSKASDGRNTGIYLHAFFSRVSLKELNDLKLIQRKTTINDLFAFLETKEPHYILLEGVQD